MQVTPEETQERDAAIASAVGSWAIIRKGKRDGAVHVHKFKTDRRGNEAEILARYRWSKLDIREGWAILIDPTGKQIAAQSAPWGVRGRGRW